MKCDFKFVVVLIDHGYERAEVFVNGPDAARFRTRCIETGLYSKVTMNRIGAFIGGFEATK